MYFIISKTKPRTELAQVEGREDARAKAKELGGTVLTPNEWAEKQDPAAFAAKRTAAKNARYPSQVNADATKAVREDRKATRKVAKAEAKKVRAAKPPAKKQAPRVETSAAVIAKGVAALKAAVKEELNKVGIVRAVASIKGLQRRDVMAIIQADKKLSISPATIATQFQLTRSAS